MRTSVSFITLIAIAAISSAADLGSPVPMPAKEPRSEEHVTRHEENSGNSMSTLSSLVASGSEFRFQACPCVNNCECKAGQCPACPAQQTVIPTTPATYRQVWVRGMGWVWMQDLPVSTSGGCAGGTCALPGRSR